MSVGFIGLGNIGKPMAKRLLRLGEPVWVYDVAQAPVDELVGLGARTAAPALLAGECRVVGLCVRDDRDVDALLQGEDGLLRRMAADSVIAVHSTVTHEGALRWAREGAARGIHVIDAPISGGAAGAEAGTLAYMVGGEAAVLERCRAVFACSGSSIIHAGPVGAGIALKLCNNLMTYAAFAAMHEADALARAGGLDPRLLIQVGRANGVVTPQMEAFIGNRAALEAQGAQALQQGFAPFAALARKDLAAALASAAQLGLRLPETAHLAQNIESIFLLRP
ncbi:MAG: NAD(P)-dependent oxidoreductase [Nevskia sp.]|nr:NAD(P)-dependent oxidoreductase [Nevskia sp.]